MHVYVRTEDFSGVVEVETEENFVSSSLRVDLSRLNDLFFTAVFEWVSMKIISRVKSSTLKNLEEVHYLFLFRPTTSSSKNQ